MKKKVAILRPEPGASVTEDRAQKLGLETIKMPLFRIEPILWSAPDPGGFDGLLVTSANAVTQAGEPLQALKALPVYAVGPATAKAAEEAGLTVAAVGRQGIASLLRNIDPDLKLLHIVGEDSTDYRLYWQKITPIVVYRSVEIDDIDAKNLEGNVALIYSPRAGKRLAEIATGKNSISIAAISGAAARACGGGWQRVRAVPVPKDAALLALAAKLCDKPDPE